MVDGHSNKDCPETKILSITLATNWARTATCSPAYQGGVIQPTGLEIEVVTDRPYLTNGRPRSNRVGDLLNGTVASQTQDEQTDQESLGHYMAWLLSISSGVAAMLRVTMLVL